MTWFSLWHVILTDEQNTNLKGTSLQTNDRWTFKERKKTCLSERYKTDNFLYWTEDEKGRREKEAIKDEEKRERKRETNR